MCDSDGTRVFRMTTRRRGIICLGVHQQRFCAQKLPYIYSEVERKLFQHSSSTFWNSLHRVGHERSLICSPWQLIITSLSPRSLPMNYSLNSFWERDVFSETPPHPLCNLHCNGNWIKVRKWIFCCRSSWTLSLSHSLFMNFGVPPSFPLVCTNAAFNFPTNWTTLYV